MQVTTIQCLDIIAPNFDTTVEIQQGNVAQTLYVHVDGITVLRVRLKPEQEVNLILPDFPTSKRKAP